MLIINQLKFKAGHSKPLCRASGTSWQTGQSSKEATDFEEAPKARQADSEARELRGRLQGPRVALPTSRPASCMTDFKARQLRGRRATRSGRG